MQIEKDNQRELLSLTKLDWIEIGLDQHWHVLGKLDREPDHVPFLIEVVPYDGCPREAGTCSTFHEVVIHED
jgi:hypothetical protein